MHFKIYLSQDDKTLACSDISFTDDEHFFNPAVVELPYIEFEDNGSEIKLTYAKMTLLKEYLKDFNLSNRKFKVKVVDRDFTIFDGYAIRVSIDETKVSFRLVDTKEFNQEMLSKENSVDGAEFYVPVLFGEVPYAELPMVHKDNLEFRLPINGTAKRCYSGSNEIDFSVENDKAILWYENFRTVRFTLSDEIIDKNLSTPTIIANVTETSITGTIYQTNTNTEFKIIDSITKTTLFDFKDANYGDTSFNITNLTKATSYNIKAVVRDKNYHGINAFSDNVIIKTLGKTDTEILSDEISKIDNRIDEIEDSLTNQINNLDDKLKEDIITRMSDNGQVVKLYNASGAVVTTISSNEFNSNAWENYKALLSDILSDGKITKSEAKSLAKAYDKLDGKIDNRVGDVNVRVDNVDGKIDIVDNKKVDKTTTANTVMTFKSGSRVVGKITNYSSSGLGILNETGVFLTSRLKQNSQGQVDWNTSGDSFIHAYNDYVTLAYVKNKEVVSYVKCQDKNVHIGCEKLYLNGTELSSFSGYSGVKPSSDYFIDYITFTNGEYKLYWKRFDGGRSGHIAFNQKGPKGDRGPKGDKGDKGDRGPRGYRGASAKLPSGYYIASMGRSTRNKNFYIKIKSFNSSRWYKLTVTNSNNRTKWESGR